ncbi:LPS assembly lipoprotein LptE [Vibrio sp. S4M6]|uniref:LPS-assembly lipoprotein LptE n=1 Tax=Vibrio sinus TaxID=2946865 RepID=UPI00202A8DDC|nr:LPS assembly lipoprotein LptE [Vibrio sinus]MCL9782824.1 LPS assembly lipoprotein LptE [Vibrio sinus]
MRLKPYFKFVTVLFSALLLSACGFHLRGDYSVPAELSKMSVTSYDQYSVLTRDVKNQLRLSKVDLVAPAKDIPNLYIMSESTGTTTLSLYQNTQTAEQQLKITVSYQVTIPDLGSKVFTTTVTRTYLANSLAALAKSVEVDMLENEMRKTAAERILTQMSRLKANIRAGSMTLTDDGEDAAQSVPASETNSAIQAEGQTTTTSETNSQPSAQ